MFHQLKVKNYRLLADAVIDLNGINVFFGPNGSGKSTLLDTIWCFRDCAIRGVELASGERDHGIGLRWDGADEGEPISISLSTAQVEYELKFGLSSGRIEPFPGECLRSLTSKRTLIQRSPGSDKAELFNSTVQGNLQVPLREPEKLSLGLYLDFNRGNAEGQDLDSLLRLVRFYPARSFAFRTLKRFGSESDTDTRLWERGENLWSVLRILHDRRHFDDRYDTIMRFMKRSFPTFDGLFLEQTGPNTVYGASWRRDAGTKFGHPAFRMGIWTCCYC